MEPWWKRFDGRLDQEVGALAALGLEFSVDTRELAAGRVVLNGAAPAGRLGSVEISIVYPGTFPHTRPAIYQTTGDRLPRHQHPFAGNYCLIGRRSDYWRPSMTAAELLGRLPDLVHVVDVGGRALAEAEDPQGEPVTTYYEAMPLGCVLVPPSVDDIPEKVTGGHVTVRFDMPRPFVQQLLDGDPTSNIGQGLLVKITAHDGTVLSIADQQLSTRFNGPEWTGRWVRISNDALPPPDPAAFAEHVKQLDPHAGRPRGVRHHPTYALHAALFTEEIRQGQYGQTLVFVGRASRQVPAKSQRQHLLQPPAVLIRGERYSPDTLRERIPHLRALTDVTVAVVGLGTLGAPLANALAQAQTGHVRLADHDVVDAGTAVRWPAGVPAAGVHKAIYLAADIGRHHPFIDVRPFDLRVGQTAPPGSHPEVSDLDPLIAMSDGVDLIVDATTEDNVSRALADVATHLSLPQLYLWSVDGYGGVVALIRPERTGCFHCLSHALSSDGHITPPPAARNEQNTRVQPRGCADPTFVATAPDMLPLVNQATRVAMSMLTEDDPLGYGAISDDVFVLALREPDGRPLSTPRWRSYKLPPSDNCWYCQR